LLKTLFIPANSQQRGRSFQLLSCFILMLLPLLHPEAFAQQKRVNLVQADVMSYDKRDQDVRQVHGRVVFEHDSAFLYCDSAAFNERSNHVEAYGNVRIRINDTVNLYGKELFYDGQTRVADMRRDVRLVDGRTVLETPMLSFDRNTRIARYQAGGRISDAQNVLTSDQGSYFMPIKRFFFKSNVKLVNPRYTMTSDTLQYHTVSGVADFMGPTTIVSDENVITCRQGWYDTQLDLSSFSRGARLSNQNRNIFSDSLFYNRNLGEGRGFHNTLITDTSRQVLISGHYALYQELEGYALVTDSTLARFFDGPDTLYIHADTLEAWFDTTNALIRMEAYYQVKYFRTDIQGLCDSLTYLATDSMIIMLGSPVIWSEDKQMFADTIRIWLEQGRVHEMELHAQAMIISMDGLTRYNQLKGKHIMGYFVENELVRMKIEGNAETVYYIREDNGRIIGLNRAVASDMNIRLVDREIKEIVYIREPSAILHPIDQVPAGEDRLSGFQWLGHRRPKRPIDVFYW